MAANTTLLWLTYKTKGEIVIRNIFISPHSLLVHLCMNTQICGRLVRDRLRKKQPCKKYEIWICLSCLFFLQRLEKRKNIDK